MSIKVSKWFTKFLFIILFSYSLFAYALPFNIVPLEGTILPTFVNFENGTAFASYTVTNNTSIARNDNYVKYFPTNVRQITGSGFCDFVFSLAAKGSPGDSCTLQLEIFGPVNGSDPDPHHHLFVCFPGGLTCAGTLYGLNVNSITLTSITVTPDVANIFLPGTFQFIAKANYSDGTSAIITDNVTWQSSNENVATITAGPGPGSGLATGVAEGVTTISASALSMTSNLATLNVGEVRLVKLTIIPNPSPDILVNQNVNYTAQGTYSDNTTKILTHDVTWKSSSPSVADFLAAPNSNIAKGLSVGTTTISAEKNSTVGIISNTTTLNVKEVILNTIEITPLDATAIIGQTTNFEATGTFSDGTTSVLTNSPSITWESSNNSFASVTAKGKILANSIGVASISAHTSTVNSLNPATLTVTDRLESIDVTPATTSPINVGGTVQFMATGHYASGNTQDLTTSVSWQSTETTVATISATGLAKGVGQGITAIFATKDNINSNGVAVTVNP